MTPPPPLRTDGTNVFARYSMRVRVPKILDEIRERNTDYPPAVLASLEGLAQEIRDGAPLPPLAFPAPDEAEWEREPSARRWLDTEWFFAECYVYRCVVAAVRWWESGRDPFAPAKREELANERLWASLDSLAELRGAEPRTRIAAMLTFALWGNRVDLSYQVGAAFGRHGGDEDLLIDDRAWAAEKLLVQGANVHIVADNTGSELSMDLALADALLELGCGRVSFHVKMHPMFVSDAIASDVWDLVRAMGGRGGFAGALADRLRHSFDDGRLRVVPDFFWNGPRFLWDRPARLCAELDRATIVVLKGDANYRRAVGDAMWPPDARFADATSYFRAPVIALRTMKSDALVGVPAAVQARLDAEDPEWRINGRRGLVQGTGGA